MGRKPSWRVANKEATKLETNAIRFLPECKQFLSFQTPIMAALIKKAPVLVNTALEIAKPQLNTFLRYAKVHIIHSPHTKVQASKKK